MMLLELLRSGGQGEILRLHQLCNENGFTDGDVNFFFFILKIVIELI
jgi:hypothetical protein